MCNTKSMNKTTQLPSFDARSYILDQMAYAEEQLMIADDMNSKLVWGNRLDALEDALYDLNQSS